jgi:predicted  nucleic acid-binding Zn-ribbon protein
MTEADNALMLAIPRELRAELRQHRTMLLQLVDATRRHDRRFEEIETRISDTRAEIELMLKAELFGRLTHFETQMDERLAQLSDRLSAVERREG